MPANSPYPGESQEQFAMRQKSMNPMAGEAPESYGQPQDDGGGEAGVRQAIAQRFPDALPDKLDEVYQAWQEHSHWAQRQGQEADLEQFFQQYEADAQGFGGREVNQELPPEVLARIKEGQGQEHMQEMPTSLMQQSDAGQYPAPSPQEREAMKNTMKSTMYGTMLGGRGPRGIRKSY